MSRKAAATSNKFRVHVSKSLAWMIPRVLQEVFNACKGSRIVLWGREAGGIALRAPAVFCTQNDWWDLSMEINCNISLSNLGCAAFLTFFQIM